jgi:hypothetical protein
VKKKTLSVDAERKSTVKTSAREYPANLAADENRASRARARLQQLSKQSQGQLGKKTWSREELYGRLVGSFRGL